MIPQQPPDLFLEENNLIEDIEVALHGEVAESWNEGGLEKLSWQMVKQATNSDEELVVIRKMLEEGDIIDVKTCPVIIKYFAKNRIWQYIVIIQIVVSL